MHTQLCLPHVHLCACFYGYIYVRAHIERVFVLCVCTKSIQCTNITMLLLFSVDTVTLLLPTILSSVVTLSKAFSVTFNCYPILTINCI